MAALPVWTRVSVSKASSQVPKPPGKYAMACASRTRKSLRVKKYLNVMSLGSSAIHALASCSNGSRMFSPKDRSRPAPSCAAPMTPLPAPVITIQPAPVIRLPNPWACRETGWSAGVRADPNTVTLGTWRYGANTLNPYRSSLSAELVILRSMTPAPSSNNLRTLVSISA